MKMPAAFLSALMLLASLPGLAESQPDSDGDGVPDVDDVCPHTPPHAVVDAQGCATDEDFDGVPDGLDQCPHSDFGTAVDSDGCAANQRSSRPTAAVTPPSPAAAAPAPAPPSALPPVAPEPAAPVKHPPAQIAAPLPDAPAASPAPPPISPPAPDAEELANRPATMKANPASAGAAAPIAAAPQPALQLPAAAAPDDDQRALLDEIDRREREREAAEAATLATPALAPAAPVEPTVLLDRDPHLFSEVLFAPGKTEFAESNVSNLRSALPQLVELMQRSPKMRVLVVGHADEKTERANADKLAAARALAVHAYLIRNGVSPKRSARSVQGSAQPVVARGDSGRNRRVEILVYPD